VQIVYSNSQTFQQNYRDFVFQITPKMNFDARKDYNAWKLASEQKMARSSSKGGEGKDANSKY